MSHIENVKQVLSATLQLGDRVDSMSEETPLIGSIAELDSMAVVSVLTALEEQYGFVIDDDEISADVFETVGTLTRFVETKSE